MIRARFYLHTTGAMLLAICSAAFAQDGSNADRALAGADILLDTVRGAKQSKVEIRGATSFPEDELRTAMAMQIREIDEKGGSPARADDAAFYLGAYYRKNGYPKVQTDYSLAGDKVILKVNEGPRSIVRGLNFIGNKSYPPATLFEYMIGVTPEQFEKQPDIVPYNAGEVAAGADRVRGFYVSEGYLDATVEAADVKLTANDTRADITVHIVEGTRYVVGDVTFSGETIYPREKLIVALHEPIDGPFSHTRAVSMERNLESYYRANGYYQARVDLQADPKTAKGGRVPIHFKAVPGPIFHFDGATVKNTTDRPRLRDSFLPKRFQHLTGQVYNPEKVDEVFRELLRTGLFSTLRLSPTALPDNTVRLDFTAEEAKAREIGFTLGYGSYDGMKVGLRLADRNLFGNGRPLTFAADYTQRGISAELMYFDQWFMDHPKLNLRAKIFNANRDEEGYTKEETGARLDFGWKVTPRLELGIFGLQSKTKITDATIDPLLIGPTDYTFTSIGLTQTLDFRDSPIAPTRGWILSSAIDVGMVDNEESFTREVVRFSWYIPVSRCQLALGARVGAIQPVSESIPIDIRFFNGGAMTVRSFAERELGPKDSGGNPLGGEFYTVFNAEFTFPLGVAGLQGAVFADAGNLVGHDDAGVDDLRYALGVGLRYALPVGPLRLDYGVNPDRRPGEDFGAFHFSFGVAF